MEEPESGQVYPAIASGDELGDRRIDIDLVPP